MVSPLYFDYSKIIPPIDNFTYELKMVNDHPRYTILTVSDIRRRQMDIMSYIASVFSVSISEASTLLCHYKWNVSRLLEHWLANEETVRKNVGLLRNDQKLKLSMINNICGICFDVDLSTDKVISTSHCGHYYCKTCWKRYINTSIDESGPGTLLLRCPDPSCSASVGRDMIFKLITLKMKLKYFDYFYKFYVECKSERIKWCPAQGCERAIEFWGGSYNVDCDCSNQFCWNCGEEPHRPVECKLAKEWITTNSLDSEKDNIAWIRGYTKPCPKCKRAIEKNDGCNHMRCYCRYEFCWFCLESWTFHRTRKCKRKRNTLKNIEKERQRGLARQSAVRLTRYTDLWIRNHKVCQKFVDYLKKLQTSKLPDLRNRMSISEEELQFIEQAWKQLLDCRRVLKWICVYEYLLPERDVVKQQILKTLLTEAKDKFEKLKYCATIEFSEFFCTDHRAKKPNFQLFRNKLIKLTDVTNCYFEKLVRDLETGLCFPEQHSKKISFFSACFACR